MRLKIKAKIYSITDGQTAPKGFANVDIGGLMHINSYTVSNKSDDINKLHVFPPSYKGKTGTFKPYLEFPHSSENRLCQAINMACRSAYKHWEETGKRHEYGETFEVDLDDQRISEQVEESPEETIDISCIPF